LTAVRPRSGRRARKTKETGEAPRKEKKKDPKGKKRVPGGGWGVAKGDPKTKTGEEVW